MIDNFDIILDRYNKVKEKDVSEDIKAYMNLCLIIGYKVQCKISRISKNRYIEIDGGDYVLEIDELGYIIYTEFSTQGVSDPLTNYDFMVNCKTIDEKELFEIVLSGDLDRVSEYKKRVSLV